MKWTVSSQDRWAGAGTAPDTQGQGEGPAHGAASQRCNPIPSGTPWHLCLTIHHGLPSCDHPARQTRCEACLLVPKQIPRQTHRGATLALRGSSSSAPDPEGWAASWPLPDAHQEVPTLGTLMSPSWSGCPQLPLEWAAASRLAASVCVLTLSLAHSRSQEYLWSQMDRRKEGGNRWG